ncbi:MAG: penicillin acylase family protein [Candidatus Hydrogenedentota bacterium]
MAFAFGYAQAEDRLETLMRAYRIATGRAAAVFGPDYADSDAFALKMGHGDLAVQALQNAPPLTRDLCEGFALGVNAWIADHPARTPEWADGARPADVLALMHCYLMSFAPFDLPEVFHRRAPAFSGNAWALGPPRTKSGAPVLVINPHGYYNGPFQWYEAHLQGPRMNVAGATLCGLPVILQGHNDVLGWALTPNYPDFGDIYIQPEGGVKLPPGDPNKMQLETLLDRLLISRELLESRTYFVNTPSGMRSRSVSFRPTSRGPLVGELEGKPCSFFVGGYGDFGTLEQLVGMAASRNLGEFRSALAMRQLPCFHIVYADREGNLFYLYNAKVGDKSLPSGMRVGKIPESSDEALNDVLGIDGYHAWEEPIPANDFRYAWGDLLPLDALPGLVNPSSGYLQACGTPPWAVTGDSGMDAATVPPWLAGDRDTFRAQRVRHLLSMGKRSFQEAQAMVYDVLVPFATVAVPQLLEWANDREDFFQSAHPDTRHGLDVLGSWNFVAETNSPGMTFFNAWWTAYRQLAGPDVPDAMLYEEFMSAAPRVQEIALEAASNAAREMRNLHDAIEVPWGDVHRLRKGNYEEAIPGGLAGEPIMVTGGYGAARRKLLAGYGYAYAMAVQFGEVPESVSVSPGGVSDDPGSEHFADQLDLFAERRFKVNYFLDKDVQRYAESAFGSRATLRPVGMQAVFEIYAPRPVSVHLDTAADSPAPLPDGTVPYTVFVTPIVEGLSGLGSVDAAIYIPSSVVEEGGLDQLAVYVLDSDHGWFPAPDQSVDVETRIIRARFEGTPTCAVLGPAVLWAQAPVLAEESPAVDDVPEEPTPLEVAEELRLESEPPEEPIPEPIERSAERPSKVSEREVEAAEPETPRPVPAPPSPARTADVSTPEGAVRSGLAWGKNSQIALPGDAGAVRVRAEEALGTYATVSDTAPGPLPDGFEPVTPFVELHCSDPAIPAAFELALGVPSAFADRPQTLELYVHRDESGWQKLSGQRFDEQANAMTGSDTRPGVYAVLATGGTVEAEPTVSETPRAVSVVSETAESAPTEAAPAPRKTPPEEEVEAREPSGAPTPPTSQKPTLAWGPSVELAADGARAEFTVEAEESIGAFTKVLTEPPAPFPEDLRAYGGIVALSLSEEDVDVRIEMTLQPEESLPDGLAMNSLALYAFEPDSGWTRLENQKFDPAAGSFKAREDRPRTYVILGPAE